MSGLLGATAQARSLARARVRKLVRGLASANNRNLRQVLRLMQDARSRIVADLSGGTDFDRARGQAMLQRVEGEIRRLRLELGPIVQEGLRESITRGDADALTKARAAHPEPSLFSAGVSADLLQVANGRSADLVGAISDRARNELNAVIRRSAVGSSTEADVARAIGSVLGPQERPASIFGTLATQVARVQRTETAALYETAGRVREEVVARESPFVMLSVWVAILDSRVRQTHRDMNGAIIEIGQHFNFAAGKVASKVAHEEARREGLRLGLAIVGPHDSVLPASEAVHCRCTTVMKRGRRKEGR